MTGLWRYAAGRLAGAGLALVGAIVLLCALTSLIPGDAATILLGPRATPELVARLNAEMGLDRPLPQRVALFLGQALQGDLGRDVIGGRPVAGHVLAALPNTLALTVAGLGLAVLLGVPLGVRAASRPGGLADQAAAVGSVALISTPSFVVGLLLLLVFSLGLGWFPVLGAGAPGDLPDQLHHLVLPALAIAIGWIGYIGRLVRASMLEALAQPSIRTLRAYGLSDARITYKYAFKMACIPLLAVLGAGLGELLYSSAVFAEIVFNRPGLGTLILNAIRDRNYPILQGAVLAVVLLFVLTNLAIDLSYAWLDPRVRDGLDRRQAA